MTICAINNTIISRYHMTSQQCIPKSTLFKGPSGGSDDIIADMSTILSWVSFSTLLSVIVPGLLSISLVTSIVSFDRRRRRCQMVVAISDILEYPA